MMRNNELSLAQELIGNSYTFIKQPAGILTKIENKTLQIAHLVQRIRNFMLRRLVETSDVHIANARANQEIPRYSVDLHFLIRPGTGYRHVTGLNEPRHHEVEEAR